MWKENFPLPFYYLSCGIRLVKCLGIFLRVLVKSLFYSTKFLFEWRSWLWIALCTHFWKSKQICRYLLVSVSLGSLELPFKILPRGICHTKNKEVEVRSGEYCVLQLLVFQWTAICHHCWLGEGSLDDPAWENCFDIVEQR